MPMLIYRKLLILTLKNGSSLQLPIRSPSLFWLFQVTIWRRVINSIFIFDTVFPHLFSDEVTNFLKVRSNPMQTFYKNRPATVWQISKTNQRPNWVQEAFDQNYLTWLDDRLRIVMAGLYSPMIPSLQNEKADIFHDHGVMFGITSIGYLGDYLDVTNHRVVTKEQFSKHYQIHASGTWT